MSTLVSRVSVAITQALSRSLTDAVRNHRHHNANCFDKLAGKQLVGLHDFGNVTPTTFALLE